MASSNPDSVDFERLVRTHAPEILRYCQRRAPHEEAHEAAAETFAVAWRRMGALPAGDAARYWLLATARKVLANQHRARGRRRRLRQRLAGLRQDPTPTPETVVLRNERDQEVVDALRSLKRGDRELLTLIVWEELSREQVAAVMELSLEAVHKRYQRAVGRLESALQSSRSPASPNTTTRDWSAS